MMITVTTLPTGCLLPNISQWLRNISQLWIYCIFLKKNYHLPSIKWSKKKASWSNKIFWQGINSDFDIKWEIAAPLVLKCISCTWNPCQNLSDLFASFPKNRKINYKSSWINILQKSANTKNIYTYQLCKNS